MPTTSHNQCVKCALKRSDVRWIYCKLIYIGSQLELAVVNFVWLRNEQKIIVGSRGQVPHSWQRQCASLCQRSPPESKKRAIVIPLLKKPMNLKNCSPVSGLSFVSRLVERVVAIQIKDYLTASHLCQLQST